MTSTIFMGFSWCFSRVSVPIHCPLDKLMSPGMVASGWALSQMPLLSPLDPDTHPVLELHSYQGYSLLLWSSDSSPGFPSLPSWLYSCHPAAWHSHSYRKDITFLIFMVRNYLTQWSMIVKRYHDQGSSYKRKYFTGDLFQRSVCYCHGGGHGGTCGLEQ